MAVNRSEEGDPRILALRVLRSEVREGALPNYNFFVSLDRKSVV